MCEKCYEHGEHKECSRVMVKPKGKQQLITLVQSIQNTTKQPMSEELLNIEGKTLNTTQLKNRDFKIRKKTGHAKIIKAPLSHPIQVDFDGFLQIRKL